MTTSLPAATRAAALPRFAALPVGAVAAVTAVAHLVLAAFDGRWFDEALMSAIGRHHLDFGSAR